MERENLPPEFHSQMIGNLELRIIQIEERLRNIEKTVYLDDTDVEDELGEIKEIIKEANTIETENENTSQNYDSTWEGRKVIQLVDLSHVKAYDANLKKCILGALCDDGTMWILEAWENKWHRIKDVPQQVLVQASDMGFLVL